MHAVHLSQRAEKFLDKLDAHLRERIVDRLKRLAVDPVPTDAKFLGRDEGEKVFRYRIGEYRALYKVKESLGIVLVTKVEKRPRAYQ